MTIFPWQVAGLRDIASLGAVDLVIAIIVVGSMVAALRRRAGLLGAIGSGLAAALLCWLTVGGLLAWAPPGVRHEVAASAFAQHVPIPVGALTEAGRWIGETANHVAP